MKKLNKKQIICILIFAISTILYLIMAIWLAHNFFTVIVPIAKTTNAMIQSVAYNLLFQFTLLFYYTISTFFMYKYFKHSNV